MIQRAFRYRLYPTPEQAADLERTAGVIRFVYNLALEQRRDFWRQYKAATGKGIGWISQTLELTALRAECDWIAAVAASAETYAIRELDRAFRNFFRGHARYPTMRQKGVNDGIRFKGYEVVVQPMSRKWAMVRLPKLGFIRFRITRPLRGRTVHVCVTRDPLGWHICFGVEIEHEAPTNNLPAIGIDRGVANTLALSNGEMFSTTDLSHLERRKRRAQRILARRRRGSNRYLKQRVRVSRITAKIARCRADWRHKTTTDIANRFGMVGLEELKTAKMTASGRGKRGLNRRILEQGWAALERDLAYKLEERGGTLVKVNPAFTSQECSACGTIDKRNRESQARFACRDCGFTGHADTNAAKVILRRSTPRVEGASYASAETRTVNHALAA